MSSSSPVHFCDQPPSSCSANSVTTVRPVPARRRRHRYYNHDESHSNSSTPLNSDQRKDIDDSNNDYIDIMEEECSVSSQNKTHHRISSFSSGSSFTVYEGRTFPLNQVTSSLHCTTGTTSTTFAVSDADAMIHPNVPSSLPVHPLVWSTTMITTNESDVAPSTFSSLNNNNYSSSSNYNNNNQNHNNENFFLRPLLHQPFVDGRNSHNNNCHTLSFRQHPNVSSSSATILRVSPFEPIVNDRNFNGKISPLPQEEYRAWQKRREKQHVDDVFYSQAHDCHDSALIHGISSSSSRGATSFKRPIAVSPMEMDESLQFL
jgi:hypothetical protein